MRVLVTGLTGFVGSALGPALASRGHEVRGVDRDGELSRACAGCEAVAHLANIAHADVPLETLRRVNVDGTRNAARLAAAAGVRRFIYVSSLKAVAEESARPLHPTEDTRPQDRYGQAKRDAELALAAEAAKSGLEIVILRPPLGYGPRVKGNFLALMRAVANGWPLPVASISNRRSFIYVGNLCDAIAHCLEAPQAAGRTYHLSDGASLSTPQLCRAIGTALGRRAWVFPFSSAALDLVPSMRRLTRSLETDDSAIRDELGWRPPVTFEEGLQATARWYRAR